MLLNDIIALATDETQSLSGLLRKCVVLGHQLHNQQLTQWANQELNGYASDNELPDYRVAGAQARGQFSGWGGSGVNNMPIPSSVLKPEHRHYATEVRLVQPVRAYEDVVASCKGTVYIRWPNDLVLYYQNRIPTSMDMSLVSAHQEIPKGTLVGLLDTMRTRVLNMALQVRDEVGESDDSLSHLSHTKAQKVEQAVVNIIYGGTNVIASGNANVQSNISQATILPGDWEHFTRTLRDSGLSDARVIELHEAIETDGEKTIGKKVKSWLKNAAPEVLAGGVKIGASAAEGVLTALLKQYFGLSS